VPSSGRIVKPVSAIAVVVFIRLRHRVELIKFIKLGDLSS